MELLNVIFAALGAFAFGAVWYIGLSRQWIAAAEIAVDAEGRPLPRPGTSNALPFVVGFIAMIVVAGMMRHIFAASGIDTLGQGILKGAGIGAFLITPWVAMNYAFAGRKPLLSVIDGANSIIGCAIMGAILVLF